MRMGESSKLVLESETWNWVQKGKMMMVEAAPTCRTTTATMTAITK
jgi:hypothetical protein